MFHLLLKNLLRTCICALSLILINGVFAGVTHAATLSINPATATVSAGNIVSMSILVNANGTAINTAGATIHFPADVLEVMSVSKASSIFSLWVQDPIFSNTEGTVTFMGGLPTPGFSGNSGQLISIVFRAKKQGTATIVMSDASVLANDGLGTDVLTAYGSASVQIGSSAEVPAVVPATGLPPLPIVTSTTNPNQNKWYSNSSASFGWVVPTGVSSIQTLLSKNPSSIPTVAYDNSVSQRTVDTIKDGILYFRIRYVNSVGNGPIATYKVQIDSTPPQKFAVQVNTQGVEDVVNLNATDTMSGISSYSLQIDNEPAVIVDNSSIINNQYALPTQRAGNHSLAVIAYDRAGNHTESDTTYTSLAIIPPTIAVIPVGGEAINCQTASVECSVEVNRTSTITVKGETKYPNTSINIYIQAEGGDTKTYHATTGADGRYLFTSDPFDTTGIVTVWSELAFESGVLSPSSNKVTIHVHDGLIVSTSKAVIYSMTYIIIAVLLITILLFITYLGWHDFLGMKRRIQKETDETLDYAHKSLSLFKDELENQLHKLEKLKEDRDLNRKEEKIFKELKANIDNIDDFIEKKIKKIK